MQWFKHDIGSYKGEQIQALRISAGGEAVDLYYALVEEMYENEGPVTFAEKQVKTKCFLFAMQLVFKRFCELLDFIEDAELLEVSRVGEGDGTVSVTVSSRRVLRTVEEMRELSEKRRQSGKMGGRPRKAETKRKANANQVQTKSKPIAPKTNKTIKTIEKEVSKDTSKKSPEKHHHGEFGNVLLTDEELAKLKERFPNDWRRRIDDLDVYVGKTGKKYKSHYMTIISWARSDEQAAGKTLQEVAREQGFDIYRR